MKHQRIFNWIGFLWVAVCSFSAQAFEAELLLVPEASRARVLAALAEKGRADEAALYRAVWQEDEAAFERAARTVLAARWDRALARFLLQRLEANGRADEAAALACELAVRKRRPALQAATPEAYDLSGRRPVVFLHGYNGSADTWSDFKRQFRAAGYGADDLLVFQFYDDDDNSRGAASGLTTLGYDTDKPIEKIAEKVVKNTRKWLRRRAGYDEADASHDAELPASDFICHSMGGLVFRRLYSAAPELVHRCVDLGTPHFGQNISSSWTGYQTEQMKYGSSFLWSLAEDWFFRGKACRDMIFIVGAGENNSEIDPNVEWDGLVCAFSATLLTLADGEAYARRTFFVNRTHSSAFDLIYKHPGLPILSGANDPVFRLAYGYLNDSHYFAGGAVPAWQTVLADDETSANRRENIIEKITQHGGLFVQARHPVVNSATSIQKAIKYYSGSSVLFFWGDPPDAIVESLLSLEPPEPGKKPPVYTADTERCYWEHGHAGEGCTNGLVQIYGNIPVGDYLMSVKKPSKNAPSYTFPYSTTVTIAGGGTRVVRTRPGNAEPQTSFTLRDDRGTAFALVVPNAWLATAGVVASAEDLAGCVAAGARTGANGCSVAASYWLGLNPADPASRFAFSAVAAGAGEVALAVDLGGTCLFPEAAAATSATRTTAAKFWIQSKASALGAWEDVRSVTWQPGDGLWRVAPEGPARFYRAVARP